MSSAFPLTWRLSCIIGVMCALCLPALSSAQDKKSSGKAKDGQTIIIQLDASKLPPEFLKQLLALSKSTGKDDTKKSTAKKDSSKKPNIVQVDLNKLSPDLAKRLTKELDKIKSTSKKKNDDDDDRKPSKRTPSRDDDDKKSNKGKVKKSKDREDESEGKSSGKESGKNEASRPEAHDWLLSLPRADRGVRSWSCV